MAKNVKEYFKITDKEWSRTSPEIRTKKIQQYNKIKRKEAIQGMENIRKDLRSDTQLNTYGDSRLFKGDVKETLEKAGLKIKRVRNK